MVVSWDELEEWIRHRIRMQEATKENFERVGASRFSNAVVQLLDASFFPVRIEAAGTPEEVSDLFSRLAQDDLRGKGIFSFKVFVGRDAKCAERLASDFRERYVSRAPVRSDPKRGES